MEWDRIEGKWQHFKGNALRHWGKLTGDQLDASAGKREQLARKIQEAYRISGEEAATTMRVKKAIYNDASLKVMDISVTTEAGVVDLTGTVKSKAERSRATAVATKVEGVKRVKNDLKVE